MKPTRPPRPAPRTLAATPPPAARSPQGAVAGGRFPALAVALAGGVLLPARESPQCGDTRSDELERHGRMGASALRAGRAGDAIEEIGVALGVVRHGSTSRGQVGGAPPPITPNPPPPTVPIVPTDGRPHVAGGPMRVLPHDTTPPAPPPTVQTRPHPRTPHAPPPHLRPRIQGGAPAATPQPPASMRGGEARVSPLPTGLPTTRA